ncbi:MAG: hypothetical protein H6722_02175 [Sandaracinus sp.]|nr:hypothetical protein [Sandaracinus sp.]
MKGKGLGLFVWWLLHGVALARDGSSLEDYPENRVADDAAEPALAEPALTDEDEVRPRRLAMPIGLELGWRRDADGTAALVGGELTLVWYRSGQGDLLRGAADGSLAVGVVAGGVWVTNPSAFRGNLGLQFVGYFGQSMAGGLEACVTMHSRGDLVGFRARGFLGWYGPSIYVGVDYHDRAAFELGILLKVPIVL